MTQRISIPVQSQGQPVIRRPISRLFNGFASQLAGIVFAIGVVAAFHWPNDGLWFQDASRHAMNGLFWWDLVGAHPADPLTYTIRYYARYPVISPATYPPLFYLIEGFAFSI